jgi:hypothetical protein
LHPAAKYLLSQTNLTRGPEKRVVLHFSNHSLNKRHQSTAHPWILSDVKQNGLP